MYNFKFISLVNNNFMSSSLLALNMYTLLSQLYVCCAYIVVSNIIVLILMCTETNCIVSTVGVYRLFSVRYTLHNYRIATV